MAQERYFEDVQVGQVLRSARKARMAATEIAAFARQFDPHPAHLDEESARTTMFGRMCASGWHTAAVTNSLIFETLSVAGGGAGSGIEKFRWLRPVYPGDELRVEIEVLAARPSRSRPEAGVVSYRCVTLNQADEPVQEFCCTVLMPRRQGTTES